MIYWQLFLGFLKVGCFSFGGAYSAIPLIRDVVQEYGWLSDEMLTHMIAISESTPGPIMINLATYVGASQAGVLGAALATLIVAFPAFLIILLVISLLKNALENRYVQAVLKGLVPCVIGVILATGVYMTFSSCVPMSGGAVVDISAVIIVCVLVAAMAGYKAWRKKKLSPIMLIVLSAILGLLVY